MGGGEALPFYNFHVPMSYLMTAEVDNLNRLAVSNKINTQDLYSCVYGTLKINTGVFIRLAKG